MSCGVIHARALATANVPRSACHIVPRTPEQAAGTQGVHMRASPSFSRRDIQDQNVDVVNNAGVGTSSYKVTS